MIMEELRSRNKGNDKEGKAASYYMMPKPQYSMKYMTSKDEFNISRV